MPTAIIIDTFFIPIIGRLQPRCVTLLSLLLTAGYASSLNVTICRSQKAQNAGALAPPLA